ncbi:hypothetical protein DQP57_16585 [Mycobacterium colombiense]|uniref:Uncharacterized protein n=1 Tax=Mycobacterium colombiense TaxID=339268 RepID=A0A329LP95_9MYCO|nr:hypothetical protein DQP57_16585 [Mycobacterium colombiense]
MPGVAALAIAAGSSGGDPRRPALPRLRSPVRRYSRARRLPWESLKKRLLPTGAHPKRGQHRAVEVAAPWRRSHAQASQAGV